MKGDNMNKLQAVLLITAFFLLPACAFGADVPAKATAPVITDETLSLQAQLLTEKAGRLEAEYRLTIADLTRIKGEIKARQEAKKKDAKK